MSNQTDFSMALLDPQRPCPAELISWNGSDPEQRFSVYRNNVVSSLINALADNYPVVEALVGADFFSMMAHNYVRQYPPTSRILVEYGDSFADFIADFEPAASVAYLADVARIEWSRIRAYHAADIEPITAVALAAVLSEPEHVSSLCFSLHPSLTILESRFAHVSIWAAHQDTLDLSLVDPDASEIALVLRNQLNVEVMAIEPADAAFIRALQLGLPFAKAAECALDIHPKFNLSPALAHLINTGAIVDFTHVTAP